MGCGMGFLLGLCAFDLMEDLVALVDAGPRLLLARKARCVIQITDDPSIPEVNLRREIELDRHAFATAGQAKSSGESPLLGGDMNTNAECCEKRAAALLKVNLAMLAGRIESLQLLYQALSTDTPAED
jgi:hypothetical protein